MPFALAVVVAVVLLAGQESAAATTPWRADNPPAGPSPTDNEFRGISAIPGTSAFWTVGWREQSGTHQALIERRTASGWQRFPTPSFPRGSELDAVVAKSAHDAWAVGERRRPARPGFRPLVLRWNGTAWTQVAAANAGSSAALKAVTITAAGHVVAVGSFGMAGALVERWNGSTFVRVPITYPRPLDGIASGPDGGLWAVGSGFVLHRRPRSATWHAITPPPFHRRTALTSVLVTGPGTTVWVFGGRYTAPTTRVAVIERYQHGAWTVVSGLAGGENATSAARLGGDGFLVAGTSTTGVFVWSDDGTALTAMTVPQPVANPRNARIIGIAHARTGIAEFAGWRALGCTAPCQNGVFPFAERNP